MTVKKKKSKGYLRKEVREVSEEQIKKTAQELATKAMVKQVEKNKTQSHKSSQEIASLTLNGTTIKLPVRFVGEKQVEVFIDSVADLLSDSDVQKMQCAIVLGDMDSVRHMSTNGKKAYGTIKRYSLSERKNKKTKIAEYIKNTLTIVADRREAKFVEGVDISEDLNKLNALYNTL